MSLGRLQTGHTYLLPPQVCGRLWLGWRLGVHTCSLQIDFFAWYKISFKFFVQAFFCWLLTCVYHIYCIIVNWYWKFPLGVLANSQWAISKPDIQNFSPHRFVESCGKGAGFFTFCHQFIDWFQGSSSSSLLLVLYLSVEEVG